MEATGSSSVGGGGGGGGGGTLSELYQSTRRALPRMRDGIEKLERYESSSSSSSSYSSFSSSISAPLRTGFDPAELSFAIKKDLSQIESRCSEMVQLLRSIPGKAQRDLWKRKVEQVVEEVESLKESLQKHISRQQKRMLEAKERAELLQRANQDSTHVLIFDEEAQAMQSAHNSHIMLEEAYATGVAVLSKYSQQRDRLKRAQRKAFDILNTVGLSNSVLKLVERRHRVDKWIAYAGMIATVIVVFAFWRWTH